MTDKRATNILTVVLATTIPIIAIGIFALALSCSAKKRRSSFLRRGVTPIDDEEIATWRIDRNVEKDMILESRSGHAVNNSVGSIQKPPSVIVYQQTQHPWGRLSEDKTPLTPKSLDQVRASMEAPPAAVLARAPNSRPGLTDEMVQGDDAFIPQLKRQPSRLAKIVAPGSPRHTRAPSAWANNSSNRDPYWYGQNFEHQLSPRRSADTFTRKLTPQNPGHPAHKRIYSTSSPPTPRLSSDEDVLFSGLSPRPAIRKSDIGRALG
ncbi:hypothetical protein HJFPF1_01579 [Paramyrothecium foliicola]|nr:hypothetical protein HJFPF1_01579 [Paramyrothecium foliicola]